MHKSANQSPQAKPLMQICTHIRKASMSIMPMPMPMSTVVNNGSSQDQTSHRPRDGRANV